MTRLRQLLAVCILVSSVPTGASVLDQSTLFPQPGMPTGSYGAYLLQPWYRVGQTFQAGFTGFLDRVDVQVAYLDQDALDNGTPLTFAIYETSPEGFPAGTVLGYGQVSPPANGDPLFYGHYTLTMEFVAQEILLAQGATYALVAET